MESPLKNMQYPLNNMEYPLNDMEHGRHWRLWSFSLRGLGGHRPKILCYAVFVEGKQSYQMLFTRSKNIDPSRIYRIFKIAKYIQLPCGRTLYSRLSQNFKF